MSFTFSKPFLLLALFLVPFWVQSQSVCSPESRARLEATLVRLSTVDLTNRSINDLVVEIGSWFFETPYVARTLELPGDEELVIDFMGLDCTTFLETIVALSRITERGLLSMSAYEEELERIRYQNGIRNGYPSRLHYFSDWIFQNDEKGILVDVTKEIGGRRYANAPFFMSSNPTLYTQLSNPAYVSLIREAEAAISTREYYYIPKEEISTVEAKIKSGDLIAITTAIAGLDVVHVGLAVNFAGRIHLLHASTSSMRVEVSDKPLHDYLGGNKSQTGIMVCRLIGQASH
jgi:hypothetical protein